MHIIIKVEIYLLNRSAWIPGVWSSWEQHKTGSRQRWQNSRCQFWSLQHLSGRNWQCCRRWLRLNSATHRVLDMLADRFNEQITYSAHRQSVISRYFSMTKRQECLWVSPGFAEASHFDMKSTKSLRLSSCQSHEFLIGFIVYMV